MPWHVVGRLSTTFFVGLLVWTFMSWPVAATDSGVHATICGDDAPAANIEITQPNDDSIVSQPTTTFRGVVSNAAQVEAQVDGNYASTVSIGHDQADFAVDLTLTEGTHTVTFTAIAICEAADDTDSIVITYQPASEPSDGGSTPTDVGEGTVVGPTEEEVEAEPIPDRNQPGRIPIIEDLGRVVNDVARSVGLDNAFTQAEVIVGVARVTLTVVAVTTVVMAGTIAPVVAQALPNLWSGFGVPTRASRRILTWTVRVGGILLLAVAYLI